MTRYLRAWQAKDAAVFCATLSPDGLKHEIYYESYYAGHQFRSCAAAASYFFAQPSATYSATAWKAMIHLAATGRVVFGHRPDLIEYAEISIDRPWTLLKIHGGWGVGV